MQQTTEPNDNIEPSRKLEAFFAISVLWAVLGIVLWALGLLNISVAWILGPAAYLLDKKVTLDLMKRACEEVIASMDADYVPTPVNVVEFHDATNLGGMH